MLLRENWTLLMVALFICVVGIQIGFTFAIPLALVYHLATNSPPAESVLGGREQVRRIAVWYCGMAACGVAGYLGFCSLFPREWSPLPCLSIAPYFMASTREIDPTYFFWGYAMLAYICMDGPLLQDRHVKQLPKQATIILTLYSVTSIAWFIVGFIKTNRGWSDPTLVVLTIANIAAIGGLWWGWRILRRNCNAWRVIAWNTALICWLFWFAHPIAIFKMAPPYL